MPQESYAATESVTVQTVKDAINKQIRRLGAMLSKNAGNNAEADIRVASAIRDLSNAAEVLTIQPSPTTVPSGVSYSSVPDVD